MTPETPIFIASIAKMFTGTAAMMLEEQERLSLDDPVSKFFPVTLLADLHRFKGQDYTILESSSGLKRLGIVRRKNHARVSHESGPVKKLKSPYQVTLGWREWY